MLLELRGYIQQQGMVSSQQLIRRFRMDWEALLPLLRIWEGRGVIQAYQKSKMRSACQRRCGGCSKNEVVYYRMCIE